MDIFKKIFLFLLELEEQKNQEISKMVNMKNSMVHTNLNESLNSKFDLAN